MNRECRSEFSRWRVRAYYYHCMPYQSNPPTPGGTTRLDIACHRRAHILLAYVREGSLFRENAAASVGL